MLLLAAATLVAVGVWFSRGAPYFSWQNTTLLVSYSPARWLGPLAIGLGASVMAWAVAQRFLRFVLGAGAIAAIVLCASRQTYRLEADSVALVQRGLFGTDRVTWREVGHVDSGPAVIVVWGGEDRQVRIRTGDVSADDRAILDRTIARRVREGRPESKE
jgi:hypothetical protein